MKNILFHRDFLMFVTLLLLLKIGIDIRGPVIESPTLSAPNALHRTVMTERQTDALIDSNQESHHNELSEASTEKATPFMAHEIDQSVLKQIDCAIEQTAQAIEYSQPTSLDATQLHSLKHTLMQLRSHYIRTSPAVAMLGPLGTAAIVLKEQKLEEELLNIVQRLAVLLHNLVDAQYEKHDSIVAELESNHHILQSLTRI